jgi:hypothetical protein
VDGVIRKYMHAKRSIKRKTKQQSWPTAESCGAETAVFATLGLVAIIAVVLALVAGSMPARGGHQLSATPERSSIVKYLDSGQFVADTRTLAAIAQYILEPETIPSNAPESWRNKNVALPTNNATGARKV